MPYCKSRSPLNPRVTEQGMQRLSFVIPMLLTILTVVAGYAASWQWERYRYHQALIQSTTSALQLPPLSLNQASATQAVTGQLISVTGQWLAASAVRIAPRMEAARMGEWLIQLFQYKSVDGSIRQLAVHRGWRLSSTIEPSTVETVTLKGQSAQSLGRSLELSKVAPPTTLGVWQNYDVTQHSKIMALPLDQIILIETADPNDKTAFVRVEPNQALLGLRDKADKNKGYMLQWLGLAMVGFIGLLWMIRSIWQSRPRVDKVNLKPSKSPNAKPTAAARKVK